MNTPSTFFSRAVSLLLLGTLTTFTAQAALQDFDSFDYTGTALPGQNGGTGWNGGWFTTGTSLVNGLSNDGVSLSNPASFESPLVAPVVSGSRVSTQGLANNASTSRLLSQTIPLNVDGTVRFASALVRKNRPNGEAANDNILIEFADASANRRWGFGIEGGTDKPWLNANASTTPATGSAVTTGDTYLIVTKVVSSGASLDTAYLKVFGTGYATEVPATEPALWDASQTQTTGAILDRIRIRIDAGNTNGFPGEVDEVRIADNWQDVVAGLAPVTQPTLTISRNGSDITISWPTSATGFELQSLESLSTTAWTDVSTTPVVNGSNYTVTVSNGGATSFYRLMK